MSMNLLDCKVVIDLQANTTHVYYPDGSLMFLIGTIPDIDKKKPITVLFEKQLELKVAMLTVEKIRAEIEIDRLKEEAGRLERKDKIATGPGRGSLGEQITRGNQ